MPVRKLTHRTLGSSHAVPFDRCLLYCVRGGGYPNRRLSEPTLACTLRFRFSEVERMSNPLLEGCAQVQLSKRDVLYGGGDMHSAKEEKSLTSWLNA